MQPPSVSDLRYTEAQRLIAVLEGDIEKLRAERDEALRAERDWAQATAKTATDALAALRVEVGRITDDTDFAVDEFGSSDLISIDPGQVAPVMVLRSVASRLRAALNAAPQHLRIERDQAQADTQTVTQERDDYRRMWIEALSHGDHQANVLTALRAEVALIANDSDDHDTRRALRAALTGHANPTQSPIRTYSQTKFNHNGEW